MTRRTQLLRSVLLALAVAVIGLAPAACGKKGAPELPEGQTDQYPRQYPDPSEL
jgi:hypothetical protein